MSRPRYVRHRKFNRLQHSVQFLAWLDVQAVRLDTTAKAVFEELMVASRMSFEQVEAAEELLAPAAPTNEAVPSITGTAKAGEVLTVVPGKWIGVPEPVLSYVWVRNDGETDTVIEGATEATYTLTEEDVGLQIFVRETATNDSGSDYKESQATAVVEAADEGEE